jgi:hypothetical protein
LLWRTPPTTTKGDVSIHDGVIETRLPVGLDNRVLTADSTTTTGLAWKSVAAASPSVKKSYSIVPLAREITVSSYVAIGGFAWKQSEHAGYTNIRLIAWITWLGRSIQLRVVNVTTATTLWQGIAISATGIVEGVLTNLPTADALIELQAQRGGTGTNSSVSAAQLEFAI